MPSKSKRNRRSQAQRAYLQRAAAKNMSEAISPLVPGAETPATGPRAQMEKPSPSYASTSKGVSNAAFLDTSFAKDIKWIGLVTGIIIVLLVVSYYVFR